MHLAQKSVQFEMQQGFIISDYEPGRLSLVSEKKRDFTVVFNLTERSRMLLKYYLSSCGMPLPWPSLDYTLESHMMAHNGKDKEHCYLTVLFPFCTFKNLSLLKKQNEQQSYKEEIID